MALITDSTRRGVRVVLFTFLFVSFQIAFLLIPIRVTSSHHSSNLCLRLSSKPHLEGLAMFTLHHVAGLNLSEGVDQLPCSLQLHFFTHCSHPAADVAREKSPWGLYIK